MSAPTDISIPQIVKEDPNSNPFDVLADENVDANINLVTIIHAGSTKDPEEVHHHPHDNPPKQEKFEERADASTEKSGIVQKVQDAAQNVKESIVGDKSKQDGQQTSLKEKAQDAAGNIKEKAQAAVDTVKEKAQTAVDSAKETVKDTVQAVKEQGASLMGQSDAAASKKPKQKKSDDSSANDLYESKAQISQKEKQQKAKPQAAAADDKNKGLVDKAIDAGKAAVQQVKDTASAVAEKVGVASADTEEESKDAVDQSGDIEKEQEAEEEKPTLVEKAKERVSDAVESIKETGEAVKERIADTVDSIKEKGQAMLGSTTDNQQQSKQKNQLKQAGAADLQTEEKKQDQSIVSKAVESVKDAVDAIKTKGMEMLGQSDAAETKEDEQFAQGTDYENEEREPEPEDAEYKAVATEQAGKPSLDVQEAAQEDSQEQEDAQQGEGGAEEQEQEDASGGDEKGGRKMSAVFDKLTGDGSLIQKAQGAGQAAMGTVWAAEQKAVGLATNAVQMVREAGNRVLEKTIAMGQPQAAGSGETSDAQQSDLKQSSEQQKQGFEETSESAPKGTAESDGLLWLTEDHDLLRGLFDQFNSAESQDQKYHIVDRIITEVSTHASAEERYLYPLIKQRVEGGDLICERNYMDDQVNKETLDFLLKFRPEGGKDVIWFNKTVEKFISMEMEHLDQEEKALFPLLRPHLTQDELAKLATDLKWGKAHAPTHPHPNAPAKPLASKILHPLAAAVDKTMDLLTGRSGSMAADSGAKGQ